MALYPELLGESWANVHPLVQSCHSEGGTIACRGLFNVIRGRGVAGLLTRMAGMPRPGKNVETTLIVTPDADAERWERAFGGFRMETRQWRRGALLVERRSAWHLRIAVAVEDGGLRYRHAGSAIQIGPWRVPVPRWASPTVEASEMPDEEGGCVAVSVTVGAPLVGLVMSYRGWIRREDNA